jgi:hypothetical protein
MNLQANADAFTQWAGRGFAGRVLGEDLAKLFDLLRHVPPKRQRRAPLSR